MATQFDSTNGILGGLPVAEQTQDYFLVFKGVGGTGPEIIDNTAYFIQYVVDSDGNVSKPSQGSIPRLNALQNFPPGKITTVRIDNASGINTQLDGDHLITGLGTQLPILYTQTGIYSNSYTQSIFFSPPKTLTANVPNVLGQMSKGSFYPSTVFITGYSSPTVVPTLGANFISSSGQYRITGSAVTDIDTINFKISYNIVNTSSPPSLINVTVYLFNGFETVASDTFPVYPGTSNQVSRVLNYSYSPDSTSPFFRVGIESTNTTVTQVRSLNFEIPSTNPMPTIPISSFWSTGSHTDITWLTASANLSLNYSNVQITSGYSGTGGSFGLSPIRTQFIPQSGDRIRFGYNSERDYIIYDVITPDEDDEGYLKLKLNKVLPSNIILDNFVLHRVDNSSIKYIILDVAKDPTVDNPENPFTGIILPKYPSEKLKNNLENILSKLKQEGIIEN